MPNVLFVALDRMSCLDWLVGWVQARPGSTVATFGSNSLVEAALDAKAAPPALLIAPSDEIPALDAFMSSLLDRHRELAITAIFVHLRTPEYGLIIHEWERNGRVFTQRRCSLAQLQREVDVVLARYAVSPELAAKVRGIGFYDCITVDGQKLHVQTEVAGRSELCVRTTVHRDGAILAATTSPWPPGLSDRAAAEEMVKGQHDQTVSKYRNPQS